MSFFDTHDESANDSMSQHSETSRFKYTFFCFVLISLTNAILNYDNGVIPVILNWIQEPYKFSNTELGIMGALPYLGFITSSPFMSYIILNFSSKWAIIVSMMLNMSSLVLFASSINKYMFFLSRFFCGFTRSLFIIYYPLWVDIFAPDNHRNLWMSIIQGGIVVGITKGYIFTSLFGLTGRSGWRYSILTQNTCFLITMILFWSIPKEFIEFDPSRDEKINFNLCNCEKNISTSSIGSTSLKDESDPEDEKLSDNFKIKNSHSLDIVVPPVSSLIQQKIVPKVYSNLEHSMINPLEYSKCSKCFLKNIEKYIEYTKIRKLSTWSKYMLLCKNKIFMLTCLGISTIYFEVTGIHYWMTKIGVSHLNINEKAVHLIFSIETIAGPVLGIVSGSYLIDQLIYHYPQYPLLVDLTLIIWGSFTCIASVVLLLKQNPYTFIIGIFIILFFGAALVPTLTLTSVAYLPHNLKPAGASFFMCQYQIFGFMLGTLVPGVVVDIFNSYTTSLCIIYLSGFVGLGAMIAIISIKWNRIKKSRQKKSEI